MGSFEESLCHPPVFYNVEFLHKRDWNCDMIRYKALLVVKGFMKGYFDHTFTPVVELTEIRTCHTVAVQRGYFIQQMDFRTAFLHVEIYEEIYVTKPDLLRIYESDMVMKIRMGLYGLKQAPRLWYEKFQSFMHVLGFTTLMAGNFLYRRSTV